MDESKLTLSPCTDLLTPGASTLCHSTRNQHSIYYPESTHEYSKSNLFFFPVIEPGRRVLKSWRRSSLFTASSQPTVKPHYAVSPHQPIIIHHWALWPIVWRCKHILRSISRVVKMPHRLGRIICAVRRRSARPTDEQASSKKRERERTIKKSCVMARINAHGLQLPRASHPALSPSSLIQACSPAGSGSGRI